METVCQPSYPLNSENASPFGTRTEYLAWPVSCAEMARTPKTASTETTSETTTITTAGILLLFIATLRVVYWCQLPQGLNAAPAPWLPRRPLRCRLDARRFAGYEPCE